MDAAYWVSKKMMMSSGDDSVFRDEINEVVSVQNRWWPLLIVHRRRKGFQLVSMRKKKVFWLKCYRRERKHMSFVWQFFLRLYFG
ncbi:hypothetical protein HanRHA438_Chr11g0486131 [Helianthus annuus]|nr:hypothetical protein HanRHA438_Chr11g0486131 [Helianthus annuus]